MSILNVIVTVICVIAVLFAVIYPAAAKEYVKMNKRPEKAEEILKSMKYRWQIPVILLALILMILIQAIVIIPTGYSGVRTIFGQVKDTPAHTGFNWKIPFVENIETICTKQQDEKIEGQIWSETKARTTIYYENVTVTYQINSERTSWIYANVADYENKLLGGNIVSSAIKTSSKELDDTDATNRGKIEPLVAEKLQESLDGKYGKETLIINKVTISNAEFEESYNKAIAEKQQAILEQERQQTENQTKIDKAKAEAEAKKIEAQGTKDANDLLEKSLTDQILMDKLLDKWDGKLPTVTGESGAMFDLSSLIKEQETNKENK